MDNLILVSGATGTVGSEVVRQLATKGAKVRACCHSPEKAEKIKAPDVEIVEMNYSRPETVSKAFEGAEKLFLLTPVVENMVEVTGQLVEEAKKAGVKHIVKLSVFNAGEEPSVRILEWHKEAEALVQGSGIPYTILRSNFFMQNFLMMAQPIKEHSLVAMPIGQGKISAIDVRDIGEVAAYILTGEEHAGKTYSLTGAEAFSGSQAAEVFSRVLEKQINFVDAPEDEARKGMQGMQFPEWLIEALLEFYRIIKQDRLAPVTSTVEEILGKKPLPFEQFVKDHADAFR